MNHKSSWAEENRAPKKGKNENEAPRRIIIANKTSSPELEQDILIVASKLKAYIKEKHDMNTSANVMEILSQHVRRLSDIACEKAQREGRKTVMDRDFE
jgi:histone H3/H4